MADTETARVQSRHSDWSVQTEESQVTTKPVTSDKEKTSLGIIYQRNMTANASQTSDVGPESVVGGDLWVVILIIADVERVFALVDILIIILLFLFLCKLV